MQIITALMLKDFSVLKLIPDISIAFTWSSYPCNKEVK